MKYDIDVLIVKDFSASLYEVIDVRSQKSFLVCDQDNVVKASKLSIDLSKAALAAGKKVFVPKQLLYSEVQPDDVVIKDNSDLDSVKAATKHNILNMMSTNVTRVNILNVIDYMQCYMKLLNAGIYITDDNRENKYFEIIEAAQSIKEPAQLDINATFEQQYEYSAQKQKYDAAQDNLKTLEIYLNAYDKLSKINFMHNLLHSLLDNIDAAKNIDEIDKCVSASANIIKDYFYCEK